MKLRGVEERERESRKRNSVKRAVGGANWIKGNNPKASNVLSFRGAKLK